MNARYSLDYYIVTDVLTFLLLVIIIVGDPGIFDEVFAEVE